MERFASYDEQQLTKILNDRDSKNTANVINVAVRIVEDYLTSSNTSTTLDDLRSYADEELNTFLRKFYAEVRRKNGQSYKKKSLVSIRYGLQRYFQKEKQIDIINSTAFKGANEMFKAVLVQVKKDGNGETQHKEIISDEDVRTLYSGGVFDVDSPKGLQNKVFFELMLYFCYRGRESLRDMKPSDFEVSTDAQGKRYVKQIRSKQTKNHSGQNLHDDDDKSARMYEKPGDVKCPVTSYEKYVAKLHPCSEMMWQRPKTVYNVGSAVWYENVPLGKNTLGLMMQSISKDAKLSCIYTNHCIRATCITMLDESGCEARHIMGISGHKSESSIKHYSSRLSENRKRDISCTITNKILGSSNTNTCTSTDHDFLEMEDSDLVAFLDSIEKENMAGTMTPQGSGIISPSTTTPMFNFYNSNVTINYNMTSS